MLNAISIKFDEISYITIQDNQANDIKITNSTDFEFLKDYGYSGEYDSTQLHILYLFPDTRKLNIITKNTTITVSLLESGNIVVTTTNGDDRQYKDFICNKQIKSQTILELIKKYGGNIE